MLLRTIAFFLAATLTAAPAWSKCQGTSILDELRSDDPAGLEAVFERAEAIPNGQGRFWEVRSETGKVSHLFGTFHTGSAVATVEDPVWAAFDAARTGVFELTLEEQEALKARVSGDLSFAFDFNAPPLSAGLSAAEKAALSDMLSKRGIPLQAVEQMRAWMLASLVGFPACHLKAMAAGEEALDTVLAKRLQANRRPIYGLETYEEALSGFTSISRDELLQAIVTPSALSDREEDVFQTFVDLYAAGEIAAVNELTIWLAERDSPELDARALNRKVMAELLDKRNARWMRPLMYQLNKGGAFVAVGALHLPGETGLVRLLREEGYTVTRLD